MCSKHVCGLLTWFVTKKILNFFREKKFFGGKIFFLKFTFYFVPVFFSSFYVCVWVFNADTGSARCSKHTERRSRTYYSWFAPVAGLNFRYWVCLHLQAKVQIPHKPLKLHKITNLRAPFFRRKSAWQSPQNPCCCSKLVSRRVFECF